MTAEERVLKVISVLQSRRQRPSTGITLDTVLYRDGLGLDSLGAAELSALLEMEFERDPYSEGQIPQTVRDLVRFYDSSPSPP